MTSQHNNLTRILYALCKIIRRNRAVRKQLDIQFSRAEIHTLIELDLVDNMTLTGLQELLKMEQSAVSRLAQALKQKKLLTVQTSKDDRRIKQIALTENARQVVKKIDRAAGSLIINEAASLSRKQKNILIEAFKLIADWYKQPLLLNYDAETELRVQTRRMSRALGVLTTNFLGSGLSSSTWDILSIVCQQGYPMNPKLLAEKVSMKLNSLTVILEKLESMGYLVRQQARTDSRFVEIRTNKQGIKFYDTIVEHVINELDSIFKTYSQEKRNELADLLEIFSGSNKDDYTTFLPDSIKIKKVTGIAELKAARVFVVQQLVAQKIERFVPDKLPGPDVIVFQMTNLESEIDAVCQFEERPKGYSLTLLAWRSALAPYLINQFIQQSITILTDKPGSVSIDFPPANELNSSAA